MQSRNTSPTDLHNPAARFASSLCPPSAPQDAYCRCVGSVALALADPEYLRPARRTYALSSRLLVLQGDGSRVFDLHLFPALHAIGLHVHTSYRVGGGYTMGGNGVKPAVCRPQLQPEPLGQLSSRLFSVAVAPAIERGSTGFTRSPTGLAAAWQSCHRERATRDSGNPVSRQIACL